MSNMFHPTISTTSFDPQSRKIRCSGEIEEGCTACRNRNQPCQYDPTAAMGRPRKYPRNEDSPTPQPIPPFFPQGFTANFHRVWEHPPTSFARQIPEPTHRFPDPPADILDNALAWKDSRTDLSNSSLFGSSHVPSTLAYRAPLSSYSAPESRQVSGYSPAPKMGAPLFEAFPTPFQPHFPITQVSLEENAQPIASSSEVIQPPLLPPAPIPMGFSFEMNTGFGFKDPISSQSMLQFRQEDQIEIENGHPNYAPKMMSNEPQSPELMAAFESSAEVRELIHDSEVDAIYQHFKGCLLGGVVQCHLEFMLHKCPNPKPAADIISFITCGNPSAPNFYDHPATSHEGVFFQMLQCDRGGNIPPDGNPFPSINPLEHHTPRELQRVYSRFLAANPFGWLFNHDQIFRPGGLQTSDPALVATVVGWSLFEKPRRNPTSRAQDGLDDRCYMPYFEFAEEELMKRTLWETHDALPTVQALVLLGVFRTVDKQPRAGWSYLSVAHLLARQATLYSQAAKRGKGHSKRARVEDTSSNDSQLNGLFWLLTLFRTWTALSLPLPYTSVAAILRLGPTLPECGRTAHGWAGRFLVNSAQFIDILSTLNKEESRHKRTSENEIDYVSNWLADLARRRCQLLRPNFSSKDGTDLLEKMKLTHNPHSNATLAVSLSILALNRVHPFKQILIGDHTLPTQPSTNHTPEMLQIATTEAAGALLSAASAGLSPGGSEDEESIDQLHNMITYFSPQPLPLPTRSNFDESGGYLKDGIPNRDLNEPLPLLSSGLITSYSIPSSSNSSSTMTGGSLTENGSTSYLTSQNRSPELEIQAHVSNLNNNSFTDSTDYIPLNHYESQPIYNFGFTTHYSQTGYQPPQQPQQQPPPPQVFVQAMMHKLNENCDQNSVEEKNE
ncbi:uncharacterized protein MELLADRAFT_64283 [Melampsora larici-populina 98AG31]|uniref:Transcription factor domain-containing protein n=1 Tax=Melampsora larici-populina (strain 98AG31 / pathotype 3-4-7) TaxID=747676 RepID=F4RQV7_MELLP|nr:uncharacterized protein MELLADRAFT_64283 [Melampsora larici-populina 98AG31]EGG05109.1 hypothetical protein MELLADRAFT_64283 [Melampsora larici-populina 98AG31]